MKKTILISFLLLSCTLFYGQGSSNLGFNQVLNYDYSIPYSSQLLWTSAGTITVPSNKVHKITSGSAYRVANGNSYNSGSGIKVGENIVFLYGDNNDSENHCPIWLSSGTYQVYIYAGIASSTLKGSLSIVEFNIE